MDFNLSFAMYTTYLPSAINHLIKRIIPIIIDTNTVFPQHFPPELLSVWFSCDFSAVKWIYDARYLQKDPHKKSYIAPGGKGAERSTLQERNETKKKEWIGVEKDENAEWSLILENNVWFAVRKRRSVTRNPGWISIENV